MSRLSLKTGIRGLLVTSLCLGGSLMLQAEGEFSDLDESHRYHTAVHYGVDEGYLAGNPDGTFEPDESVNRIEFTKTVVSITFDEETIADCELPDGIFSDTEPGAWYEGSLCIAWTHDIISGYPDGTFRPEQSISLVEAAKIVNETLGESEQTGAASTDLNVTSNLDDTPWYTPYLESLAERHARPATVTSLTHPLTRGEMADLLYRFQETLWFQTGQAATLMLSGFGFNTTGGPDVYNHPTSIATGGDHLFLVDRNNNRVLVWTSLPTEPRDPDLVLGQAEFTTNAPGTDLNEFNWPTSVSTDGERLIVTDGYNHRILVWKSLPTENGQAADFEITEGLWWPWGSWTDGDQLLIANTYGNNVLIWNEFPTGDTVADLTLENDAFGTPRSVATDGSHLIMSDHEARVDDYNDKGTFFWNTFPTASDDPYDFFTERAPGTSGAPDANGQTHFTGQHGEILWAPTFLDDGRFLAVGASGLYMWNQFPQDAWDAPDLTVGTEGLHGSDISGIAATEDGRLFISLSNANKVLAWNEFPETSDSEPDFVLGSPDLHTNTLQTHSIISNPVPVTDGTSLIVTSDFDRSLHVWDTLPHESGTPPDRTYDLTHNAWDNVLHEKTFVTGGKNVIAIWEDGLPLDNEPPTHTLELSPNGHKLNNIKGVALDENHFYVADEQHQAVYIWDELPIHNQAPTLTLAVDRPWRISSDGDYLMVIDADTGVHFYEVESLRSNATPVLTLHGTDSPVALNRPFGGLMAEGRVFIADTSYSRILAWESTDALLNGETPTLLGAETEDDVQHEIGPNQLFWPAGLAFDGQYLWVGEYKFSTRILRFEVKDN